MGFAVLRGGGGLRILAAGAFEGAASILLLFGLQADGRGCRVYGRKVTAMDTA